MNRSTRTPLNLFCWEGYEADPITRQFKRDFDLHLQAETLPSDAAIADELLAGHHPDCDIQAARREQEAVA